MHLLARKQAYLRKRTPTGKEEVHVVTLQELKQSFNSRTGLNDKSKSIPGLLLKTVLSIITSSTNRVFPGGWIKSNRSINQVKSDIGLAFKMGYSERCPDYHKLEMVLGWTATTNPKGVLLLKDQRGEEFKNWTFQEFRAGCRLTAPFLDNSSTKTFDQQRKVEPLKIKSEETLKAFSSNQYYKCINTLNRAYAFLTSLQKGGKSSKTKVVNYVDARNEFLRLSDKIPIIDGTGVEYTKLSSLPSPVYQYCAKLFRWGRKALDGEEEALSLLLQKSDS